LIQTPSVALLIPDDGTPAYLPSQTLTETNGGEDCQNKVEAHHLKAGRVEQSRSLEQKRREWEGSIKRVHLSTSASGVKGLSISLSMPSDYPEICLMGFWHLFIHPDDDGPDLTNQVLQWKSRS
jgi:hypothetical protein